MVLDSLLAGVMLFSSFAMRTPNVQPNPDDYEVSIGVSHDNFYVNRQWERELGGKYIDDLFEDTFSEDLRKWFSKDDPQGDWKRIDSKGNVVGPCARKPGEPKPKCMSKATRAKLSKKERAAAVRTKRKHDKVADRAGKGGKPVMVSSFGKGKLTKEDSNEYDWNDDQENNQRRNRQSFGRVLEREFSEAVSHKTKKSKLGTKDVNDTFNAWYFGSQVSKY